MQQATQAQSVSPQKARSTSPASSAFFAPDAAVAAPVTPVRPSHAPASPGAMQRSFDSILARGLAVSTSSAIIQRKGQNLSLTPSMTSPVFNDRSQDPGFSTTIENVREYIDDNVTPADEYGRQLVKLKQIQSQATGYVNLRSQPGQPGDPTGPLVQMRIKLVDQLRARIPPETAVVQDQGLDQATTNHAADRNKLTEVIDSGLRKKDRRLANSIRWIREGKARLYPATATGDSDARIEALRGPRATEDAAFFPKADSNAEPGYVGDAQTPTYKHRNLRDNSGVLIKDKGKRVGGWRAPGLVAVVNPRLKDTSEIESTLRHEVQHDADKHEGRDAMAGTHEASTMTAMALNLKLPNVAYDSLSKSVNESRLAKYKTEYRAYSYQGKSPEFDFDSLDNEYQSEVHDGYLFTPRQLAIFKVIYEEYPHTREGWDENGSVNDGSSFRDAIVRYWKPDTEGMNKFNSPRIDDFIKALDQIDAARQPGQPAPPDPASAVHKAGDIAPVGMPVWDPQDPRVLTLMDIIQHLSRKDARTIVNVQTQLMKKVRTHLDDPALASVLAALRKKAGMK